MALFYPAWMEYLPADWVTPVQRVTVVLALTGVPVLINLIPVLRERGWIRRDLAARGCTARRIFWLPLRRGLLKSLDGGLFMRRYGPVYGRAYRVHYVNRDGRLLLAVCLTGNDEEPFWTDDHPEPGFDRFGNPPHLSELGTWRG